MERRHCLSLLCIPFTLSSIPFPLPCLSLPFPWSCLASLGAPVQGELWLSQHLPCILGQCFCIPPFPALPPPLSVLLCCSSGRSSLFSQTELISLEAGRDHCPAGAALLDTPASFPEFLYPSELPAMGSHLPAPPKMRGAFLSCAHCLRDSSRMSNVPGKLQSCCATAQGSRAVSILHRREPELSSTSCLLLLLRLSSGL